MTEEEKLEPTSSEEQQQPPKFKPPIRGPDWFDRLFAIAQQRRIDKIDMKFVRTNISKDPSGGSKFHVGLKFLGLIDNDDIPTPRLQSLGLSGDQFRTNLEKIIRLAYKDVFEKVPAKEFHTENLRNFFVSEYGMGGGFAQRAVYVFQYFCRKAGISLSNSEEPSNLKQESRSGKARVSKRQTRKTRLTKSMSAISDDIEQLQLGDVRIWLPKNDPVEAANVAKTLIDLYLQKLSSKGSSS
jgi:hypothetical protein